VQVETEERPVQETPLNLRLGSSIEEKAPNQKRHGGSDFQDGLRPYLDSAKGEYGECDPAEPPRRVIRERFAGSSSTIPAAPRASRQTGWASSDRSSAISLSQNGNVPAIACGLPRAISLCQI